MSGRRRLVKMDPVEAQWCARLSFMISEMTAELEEKRDAATTVGCLAAVIGDSIRGDYGPEGIDRFCELLKLRKTAPMPQQQSTHGHG